ncbi:hypothetical protein [Saccharibacillus sacchari]|uniref:Uncharacterized protein n=1 Tax=Saccharibacillus sacchari TaxID=456493 RepID=A0ACC6PE90_9BACL
MTVVGILGVVHHDELRKQTGLTLELIRELILEFAPDVICGEVLPTSWERYKQDLKDRGYWGEAPSEYYDLVFELCRKKNIAFEPIDWVELDVWNDFDPFRNYAGEDREQLEQQSEEFWQKQLQGAKEGSIPFNTAAFDEATRLKYEWLEKVDPEAHVFRWEARHLIMVQRIKNALKRHPGKKMLCIVGADHNHVLVEMLNRDHEHQIIYPLI